MDNTERTVLGGGPAKEAYVPPSMKKYPPVKVSTGQTYYYYVYYYGYSYYYDYYYIS